MLGSLPWWTPTNLAPLALDLVLVMVLIGYLIYGFRRGLTLSVASILGAVIGAVAAFFAIPLVTGWIGSTQWRLPIVLLTVFVLIGAGIALGTALGRVIRVGVVKGPLRGLDRFFGGLVSVAATAVVISMLAFAIGSLGVPVLSQAITSSRVVAVIDTVTPAPVRELEAQVRSLVAQQGIPRVLDSIGIGSPLPIPTGAANSAQEKASHSVMKITGNAYACGQNQTGSGFVIAPGRVITNAHVVAGVADPIIESPDGGSWKGTVVYFDTVNDLAVIAAGGMSTAPLAVGTTLPEGTTAVFDGYPLGGPFSSKPAAVQGVGTVRVPDIYGANPTPREVYSLAADVQQGNSGGPVIDATGTVAGVIFAKSSTTSDLGFALTVAELAPVAARAGGLTAEVPSGHCTSE
ncbi:MarP family serine protease [Lacisediminihabitans changchengi]|uniref:MarP family serine protease n=1 Tax=Lacisediminihabitans changchengi TaxID=2787634 RepID=A0A934SLJ8_9MICO|nr:MarP family serine protease [Lacisediminihabitans changchengi]MBK4347576.1 MarP family serine protease [Lacisediminihabitans changchengi]